MHVLIKIAVILLLLAFVLIGLLTVGIRATASNQEKPVVAATSPADAKDF